MKPTNKAAVIDIGTLKCKFIIGERNGIDLNIVYEDKIVTMLGKDMDKNDSKIGEIGLDNLIKALESFKQIALEQQVDTTWVVTTEAIRKASNSEMILRKVKESTGFDIEIISQKDEGDLFFKSISRDFPGVLIAIVDIGGGSAQVVIGKDDQILERYLFPTGTYKLQQQFTTNHFPSQDEIEKMRDYIKTLYLDIATTKLKPEIVIYGSNCIVDYFSLTDLTKEPLEFHNHPFSLKTNELEEFANYLLSVPYESRSPILVKDPNFVWDVDKAIMNVLEAAKHFNLTRVVPTNNSVALGMLFHVFEQ